MNTMPTKLAAALLAAAMVVSLMVPVRADRGRDWIGFDKAFRTVGEAANHTTGPVGADSGDLARDRFAG